MEIVDQFSEILSLEEKSSPPEAFMQMQYLSVSPYLRSQLGYILFASVIYRAFKVSCPSFLAQSAEWWLIKRKIIRPNFWARNMTQKVAICVLFDVRFCPYITYFLQIIFCKLEALTISFMRHTAPKSPEHTTIKKKNILWSVLLSLVLGGEWSS